MLKCYGKAFSQKICIVKYPLLIFSSFLFGLKASDIALLTACEGKSRPCVASLSLFKAIFVRVES